MKSLDDILDQYSIKINPKGLAPETEVVPFKQIDGEIVTHVRHTFFGTERAKAEAALAMAKEKSFL